VTDPGTRLTEELKLLLDAVADQAGPWLDKLTTGSHDEHPVACGWCPLCALVSLLRGHPSELAGVVLERMAELIALLRAVLADRWDPGTVHAPGFRPPPAPPYEGPRVQKIPVRRADRPEG
jgi:hypothetical protein